MESYFKETYGTARTAHAYGTDLHPHRQVALVQLLVHEFHVRTCGSTAVVRTTCQVKTGGYGDGQQARFWSRGLQWWPALRGQPRFTFFLPQPTALCEKPLPQSVRTGAPAALGYAFHALSSQGGTATVRKAITRAPHPQPDSHMPARGAGTRAWLRGLGPQPLVLKPCAVHMPYF